MKIKFNSIKKPQTNQFYILESNKLKNLMKD